MLLSVESGKLKGMEHAMNDKRVYLDHASTTPLASEVLKAMMPFFDASYGNPSSMYASGRKARQALEDARRSIAEVLHSEPEEIIFTASGTESDNLALLGTARANRQYGNHILVSAIEHKAVLEAAKQLDREGFVVEYIPVDRFGMIDVDDCVARIKDNTILISVMYANNEIGTIQPIQELTKAIGVWKKKRVENSRSEFSTAISHQQSAISYPIFHADACQAAGALSLDVTELGVDLLSINGSKIYGPKGVGVLFKKKDVTLLPIVFGGGQEQGLRGGTENLPLIVGMSLALTRVEKRRQEESLRLSSLRDTFITSLRESIPDMVLNGHVTERLPNNIHISIPAVEGESMVLMLDSLGVEVSTGSACSYHDLQVSHVLSAIGQDPNLMHGSLRITLGESTRKDECNYFLSVIPDVLKRLRSMSPLTISYEQKK
jgi:cysteine desulfurase